MKHSDIDEKERDHAPLERSFEKVLTPFDRFLKSQSAAGIALLIAVVSAIILANSNYQTLYESINQLPLSIGLGEWRVSYSLHYWVNDGLMTLFFFVLGLEIKQESLVGDLANVRSASLVLFMAIGGMLVPAGIYVLIADSGDALRGWGIPMATDTAFALAILTLLNDKVPRSLAVILSALAIVDDMGAVMVISIFYTEQIDLIALVIAFMVLAILLVGHTLGISNALFYATGGILLWWFILHSGVHATTAGTLLALTIPTRAYAEKGWFIRQMRRLVNRFEAIDEPKQSIFKKNNQHELAEQAHQIAIKSTTPLQHWSSLHARPISLTILPLFAFLNAGVAITSQSFTMTGSSVMLATGAGLVIGKVIGITLFAWICLRLKIAQLPQEITFTHITGLGLLAGIGFTMSLFISALAFENHPILLGQAKLGILIGSLVAGILGALVLLIANKATSRSVNN